MNSSMTLSEQDKEYLAQIESGVLEGIVNTTLVIKTFVVTMVLLFIGGAIARKLGLINVISKEGGDGGRNITGFPVHIYAALLSFLIGVILFLVY